MPDEQVVVLSMGGNLETAFVPPAIYLNQRSHRRFCGRLRDGVPGRGLELEYEPATGRWHVRGINHGDRGGGQYHPKTREFVEAHNTH